MDFSKLEIILSAAGVRIKDAINERPIINALNNPKELKKPIDEREITIKPVMSLSAAPNNATPLAAPTTERAGRTSRPRDQLLSS